MGGSETILQAWQPFFPAQLGAAATLGGLVFVGLSLNLNKILAYAALPIRAMLALFLLLLVLIVSSIGLLPGRDDPPSGGNSSLCHGKLEILLKSTFGLYLIAVRVVASFVKAV